MSLLALRCGSGSIDPIEQDRSNDQTLLVHLVSTTPQNHAHRRAPGFAYLASYHALHHYQDIYRAYGVTSPTWDWLFGTLPARRRPPTETASHVELKDSPPRTP